MLIPLATPKQVAYLQYLTDRAEDIKMRHPSLIPSGLYHQVWKYGIPKERIGLLIQMYRTILRKCGVVLKNN